MRCLRLTFVVSHHVRSSHFLWYTGCGSTPVLASSFTMDFSGNESPYHFYDTMCATTLSRARLDLGENSDLPLTHVASWDITYSL